MRLHRGDDPDGQDEPEGGWVEADAAGPSGPLADVLQTWTVVRSWRGVKARTAAEAIAATRGEVEVGDDGYQVVLGHDRVHASRGEMAMLYHTAGELGTLISIINWAIVEVLGQLSAATSEAEKAPLRARHALLNSLRTQFTEASYDLTRTVSD